MMTSVIDNSERIQDFTSSPLYNNHLSNRSLPEGVSIEFKDYSRIDFNPKQKKTKNFWKNYFKINTSKKNYSSSNTTTKLSPEKSSLNKNDKEPFENIQDTSNSSSQDSDSVSNQELYDSRSCSPSNSRFSISDFVDGNDMQEIIGSHQKILSEYKEQYRRLTNTTTDENKDEDEDEDEDEETSNESSPKSSKKISPLSPKLSNPVTPLFKNSKLNFIPGSKDNSRKNSKGLPPLRFCHLQLFLALYERYFRNEVSSHDRMRALHNPWRIKNDMDYCANRKFMLGVACLISLRLKNRVHITKTQYEILTKADDTIFELHLRSSKTISA